jgi:hypothetical protein
MISVHDTGQAGALGDLSRFRQELYGCLTARADALFELTDAVLCTDGPVTSLAELSLTAEHRRGHGALYDAVTPRSGSCTASSSARAWGRARHDTRREWPMSKNSATIRPRPAITPSAASRCYATEDTGF